MSPSRTYVLAHLSNPLNPRKQVSHQRPRRAPRHAAALVHGHVVSPPLLLDGAPRSHRARPNRRRPPFPVPLPPHHPPSPRRLVPLPRPPTRLLLDEMPLVNAVSINLPTPPASRQTRSCTRLRLRRAGFLREGKAVHALAVVFVSKAPTRSSACTAGGATWARPGGCLTPPRSRTTPRGTRWCTRGHAQGVCSDARIGLNSSLSEVYVITCCSGSGCFVRAL